MADIIHAGVDYHCLFVRAMLPYRGQLLSTAQITEICRASGFQPMSACLPNDHASGNKNPLCEVPCDNSQYQIFDQIMRGHYRVRETLFWCNRSAAG